MRKVNTAKWLLTVTAALGIATTASAQENQFVQRADAILGAQESSLITQIDAECAPGCTPGCDIPCDETCDDGGLCGFGNLLGGLCGGLCDDGDACDGCDSCYLWEGLGVKLNDFNPCSDVIEIGGWMQSGYHNKSTGLFNSRPGKYSLHQAWLYAEKVADGSCGLDWGFRADFMYGIDADDTQAFGNNDGRWDFHSNDPNYWSNHGAFGFAIPQLYAEVAYGDLSVKAGHFFTLLGYEVVPATGNFFYSHAYTMYNSEAFTHTGVLATYSAGENVTLYGGWTLGWDTGFDQFGSGSSFLGGYSVGLGDILTLTHIITAGDLGAIGDGWSQSVVADFALSDNLNYVLQSDILDAETNETVGINQYLLYSFNECFGVGSRMEWWKANGASVYAITGGVNYRPTPNMVIRPEIRYQWDPETNNNDFIDTPLPSEGKAIFGVDAIVTF